MHLPALCGCPGPACAWVLGHPKPLQVSGSLAAATCPLLEQDSRRVCQPFTPPSLTAFGVKRGSCFWAEERPGLLSQGQKLQDQSWEGAGRGRRTLRTIFSTCLLSCGALRGNTAPRSPRGHNLPGGRQQSPRHLRTQEKDSDLGGGTFLQGSPRFFSRRIIFTTFPFHRSNIRNIVPTK